MLTSSQKILFGLLLTIGPAAARADAPMALGECRIPPAPVAAIADDAPAALQLRGEIDMFRAALDAATIADACFDAAYASLAAERGAKDADARTATERAAALTRSQAEIHATFTTALQRFEGRRAMLAAEIAAGLEPAAGPETVAFDTPVWKSPMAGEDEAAILEESGELLAEARSFAARLAAIPREP